ncbi:MAG: DUF4838 domain-containing protein, partial [Planctomycetota bacterium]
MSNQKHLLVENGKAAAQIAVSHLACEQELYAAEELASYFKKISGAPLPIHKGLTNLDKPTIMILDGRRPANAVYLKSTQLESLKEDGYLIESEGENIIISSLDPFGIVHGTYQYLARVLGVCFYDFGSRGEDIPHMKTVTHDEVKILKNSKMNYRGTQMAYRLDRLDWMVKNGFNYVRIGNGHDLEFWDKKLETLGAEYRKRGIKINFGHHNFHMFIPPAKYLEDYPHYFPEINGERKRKAQFCWDISNSDVIDEAVYRLEWFLSRHPEIAILDFWPSDGTCDVTPEDYETTVGEKMPDYQGWEEQVGGSSETGRMGNPYKEDIYAAMTKYVAEKLAVKFPELKITITAYADMTQPSKKVRLPDNVNCTIAMYWRCYTHHLFEEGCIYNDQYRQIVREWTEMYPDRGIQLSEYYMGMTAFSSLPYPIVEPIFTEWKEF